MSEPSSATSRGGSNTGGSPAIPAARTFLAAWQTRKWDAMASSVQTSRRLRLGSGLPIRLGALFGLVGLARWRIDGYDDIAAGLTEVRVVVAVRYPGRSGLIREVRRLNVIRENDAGKAIPRDADHPTARWGVNETSALRVE